MSLISPNVNWQLLSWSRGASINWTEYFQNANGILIGPLVLLRTLGSGFDRFEETPSSGTVHKHNLTVRRREKTGFLTAEKKKENRNASQRSYFDRSVFPCGHRNKLRNKFYLAAYIAVTCVHNLSRTIYMHRYAFSSLYPWKTRPRCAIVTVHFLRRTICNFSLLLYDVNELFNSSPGFNNEVGSDAYGLLATETHHRFFFCLHSEWLNSGNRPRKRHFKLSKLT